MNRLRAHLSDNHILYKMIGGFTLLCTLIIFCMNSISYSKFNKELRNEIYRYQEASLKKVANVVGFRAEYANYLLRQVQQDEEISSLFYSNGANASRDALLRLGEMRMSVKQLHSIYIYNEREDVIYCSGENNLPLVSGMDSFEDQGFVEILRNIDQYNKYVPFLRMIELEAPDGQIYNTYVYTYLLYDSYSSGSKKNIVAFNFYLGWMEDALNLISIGESADEQIWIVNDDRQVIYTSSGELVGSVVDEKTLPQQIYEKQSGYMIFGEDGKQQMLVYATPDQVGYDNWTFLSWKDYSAIMQPLRRVQMFIYLICALAFLVSMFLIFFMSKRLYIPIRKTIDKVDTLEIEIRKKEKMDKARFLRRLFLGNESDDIEKIKEKAGKYHINYSFEDDSRVVLAMVDYLNSYLRTFGKELEQTDARIEEIFTMEFAKEFKDFLCTKVQEGTWGICIPSEEQDDIVKLQRIFENINSILENEFQISVSLALSETGHSVRDIPYLYAEAVNISAYRYLLGFNRMISIADVESYGQVKFVYPYEAEKQLLTVLFAGKYEEALKAYDEFVQQLSKFSVEEIRMSFTMLAYSIKSASRNTTVESSSILMEFDQFYKKLYVLETIDEVHQMFIHLMGEITDKLQTYTMERHEVLISQMKQYVEENYGKISLSMNEVADSVNMSAAYLGRMFKQVTGMTFTEYLTKHRLTKACDLLMSTEMTVNEISDEVGFTNSSYFYIVFKKNLGCTPSQYRKKKEHDTDE